MKVLFRTRFDAYTMPGGDTTQMVKTAKALAKHGVNVKIDVSGYEDVSEYDLVHVFNLMRPYETSKAIFDAKNAGKMIVLSSIYWDFSEFNQVGRKSFIHKVLNENLDEFSVEKIKNIIRYFNHAEFKGIGLSEFAKYVFSNFRNTLNHVDLFLPNSDSEGVLVQSRVLPNARYHVVFNGVDVDQFTLKNNEQRHKDLVVASRIDPRKNLLNLVKAIEHQSLDIIGGVTPNHKKYSSDVKTNSGSNVRFRGFIESSNLADEFNKYKIHILPSWLETPGLSQLEAAACGCNIVSTNKGSAIDYFQDKATYCDPNDISSIRDAVEARMGNLINPKLMSEFVKDNFSWDVAAKQTLQAYEQVLGKNS